MNKSVNSAVVSGNAVLEGESGQFRNNSTSVFMGGAQFTCSISEGRVSEGQIIFVAASFSLKWVLGMGMLIYICLHSEFKVLL
ncbi:hypothetical protein OROGR_000874 [Orobanche gracilis]